MRASLTDRQLIKLYLSGDEGAFESLLNRHQQQIFSKIFMPTFTHITVQAQLRYLSVGRHVERQMED